MTDILEVTDLEVTYQRSIRALHGVNLRVAKGQITALLGANGAGKSSILRAITGLAPLRSGQIHYQGERLDGTPACEIVRKGIAMVPEGRRVFPYMSIKDNLLMGAFTRTDKAGVARTLESVLDRFPRLRERYGQQASTLSGGEQQMMVIGRALMAKPKLLLLDEPTEGIQPSIIQEMARTLKRIRDERGLSIVVSEQVLSFVMEIADRILVIEKGDIVHQQDKTDADQNKIASYLAV